jgi:hypothetical protein
MCGYVIMYFVLSLKTISDMCISFLNIICVMFYDLFFIFYFLFL